MNEENWYKLNVETNKLVNNPKIDLLQIVSTHRAHKRVIQLMVLDDNLNIVSSNSINHDMALALEKIGVVWYK